MVLVNNIHVSYINSFGVIINYDLYFVSVAKCMAEGTEGRRSWGTKQNDTLIRSEVNCSDKRSEFKQTREKLINEST